MRSRTHLRYTRRLRFQLEHLESRCLLSSTLIPSSNNSDFVFDASRNRLYITHNTGTIDRYDLASNQFLTPWTLSGTAFTADISPDGSTLYLSDPTQPVLRSINLATDAISSTPVPEKIYSLASLADGSLVFNYTYYPDPWGVYRYVPSSNAISTIGSPGHGRLLKDGNFTRQIATLTGSPNSLRVITNGVLTSEFGLGNIIGTQGNNAALSRDGSLIAVVEGYPPIKQIDLFSPNGTRLSTLQGAGVAFSPTQDVLYVASGSVLKEYNTVTSNWMRTIDIGETFYAAGTWGATHPGAEPENLGYVLPSADGSQIFISTYSGIRRIDLPTHAFSPTIGASTTTPGPFNSDNPIRVQLAAGNAPAGFIPTGSVIIAENGNQLKTATLEADGSVSIALGLSVGSHHLTISYAGDFNFLPVSTTLDVSAIASPTSTTLSTYTLNLGYKASAPLTVTITDSANNPVISGQIALRYIPTGAAISTKNVDAAGHVSFTITGNTSGSYDYRADYLPSANYLASSSSTLTINIADPTATHISGPATLTTTYGTNAPFTITVLDPSDTPVTTGQVRLRTPTGPFLATLTLSPAGSATFSLPSQSIGTLQYIVDYLAAGSFAASSFSTQLTVSKATPTLTASFSGSSIVVTSSPAIPGAAITLLDNGSPFSTLTLSSGTAQFSLSALTVGSHNLSFSFAGNTNFNPATSNTLQKSVAAPPATVATTLVSTATQTLVNKPVTLSISVPAAATPGSIVFFDSSTPLGTTTLAQGKTSASFTTSTLSLGKHALKATFTSASAAFAPSTSTLNVTVNQPNIIDLLAVYTQEANAAAPSGQLPSHIQTAVENANIAFANSGIPITLRLVTIAPVSYSETGDYSRDLQRLYTRNDGFMDNIHSLRNAVGADLVALFVSEPGAGSTDSTVTVGIATELFNPNAFDRDTDAFLVVSQTEWEENVLAHEVGHTLGATHALGDPSDDGSTFDSHGYRFTGNDGFLYHDIMAYDPGDEIPYFSNPNILYQGVPIGNTTSANSARVLTANGPIVASHRASATPFGNLDSFTKSTLTGWALDPKNLFNPALLRIDVDGQPRTTFSASGTRVDLFNLFGASNHGFSFDLASLNLAAGAHTIRLNILDSVTGNATLLAAKSYTVPPALFDEAWYLSHNPDIAAAVNAGITTAWDHFNRSGQFENRSPSAYFDPMYYLAKNPDIAAAYAKKQIASPWAHYLAAGQFENRPASPYFDPQFYRLAYPDIASAVASRTIRSEVDHFLTRGQFENRNPIMFFDTTQYRSMNAAGVGTLPNPYAHFLTTGNPANANPSQWFDQAVYLQLNPDLVAPLQAMKLSPLDHYIRYGQKEKRRFSNTFSEASYLAKNPDVAAAVNAGILSSGFEHYLLYGRFESRQI